jgi:hypothetical protein
MHVENLGTFFYLTNINVNKVLRVSLGTYSSSGVLAQFLEAEANIFEQYSDTAKKVRIHNPGRETTVPI